MNNHNTDDGSRERLLGRITALLWVVVVALAVTFFYYASSFWITLLLSAFLAILVEPLVALIGRLHVPRSVAATLVIVFAVLLMSATLSVFYNKAAAFMETLPEYTGKIRQAVEPVTKKIQKIQEDAGKLNPGTSPKKFPEVRVNEGPTWPPYLARGVGSVGGAVVIAGVIPFLHAHPQDHIYEWLCITFATVTDVP